MDTLKRLDLAMISWKESLRSDTPGETESTHRILVLKIEMTIRGIWYPPRQALALIEKLVWDGFDISDQSLATYIELVKRYGHLQVTSEDNDQETENAQRNLEDRGVHSPDILDRAWEGPEFLTEDQRARLLRDLGNPLDHFRVHYIETPPDASP